MRSSVIVIRQSSFVPRQQRLDHGGIDLSAVEADRPPMPDPGLLEGWRALGPERRHRD
jgi:hypothetical protein